MFVIPPEPKYAGVAEAPAAWLGPVREGLPLSIVDQALSEGLLSAVELDRLAV